MKCQTCHHTVTRKSKFCANCGARVVPRASTKKEEKVTKIPVSFAIGFVAIGLVIGYLVFRDSGGQRTGSQAAPRLQNTATSIAEIAREFNCMCGQCSHSLDECECEHDNGAVEVKGFIAQKLQEAHHKPHIVQMVQEQYGGQKNQTVGELKFDLPSN